MDRVQKVAILGAGAMGAYFASRFFNTPGFSTFLVAKGDRFRRLKEGGLTVNGKKYLIPVTSPEETGKPVDLIIVGLKNHHLAGALGDIANLVGDNTTIISVMNGLDSEKQIGKVYGMEKVLYTISVGIDAVRVGDSVTFSAPGKHIFGEEKNQQISQKVARVQEAFQKAGIVYETPEDMVRMLWWKFMINVGMNQASAVMRAPYGIFQKIKEAQNLMRALMEEVITLAEKQNVNLTSEDITKWYTFLHTLSPQGKTSMLQDIEARRKTEVEIFGGKVVEMGESMSVSTPVNQVVVDIIKVLERDSLL